MATLSAKKLQEALERAKNVGRAEEEVVIDGCPLVLRSLTQGEYEAALRDPSDLEEMEYLHAYQVAHVCRSIVQIDGVDLREVEFIEDDVPAGVFLLQATIDNEAKAKKAWEMLKAAGINAVLMPPDGSEGTRTLLLERHEWIRQRLATWGREAVSVAFRKFNEVVKAGEVRAREKITFSIPDETNEEKFRRLLTEAKELEGELPPDLSTKVLDDVGYMQKSTPEELEAVNRRAKELQEELRQQAQAEAETESEPEPEPEPPPPPPQRTVAAELHERMRNRTPMNQTAASVPVPTAAVQAQQAQQERPPVRVPPQIQRALAAMPADSRAAQIAALEGHVDPAVLEDAMPDVQRPREVAELSKPVKGVDSKQALSIIDKPPVQGINPKFRHHNNRT